MTSFSPTAKAQVLRVMHVSWVARPYAAPSDKGPGDIVASIHQQLRTLGIDARLVIPGYPEVRSQFERVREPRLQDILLYGNQHSMTVRKKADQEIYSLGNPGIFSDSTLYGPVGDLKDLKRIIFFTYAFAHFLKKSEPFNVISFHDWPTGLCLAMLKAFADRIFGKDNPMPLLLYYEYNPENRGLFHQSDLESAEMGLVKLPTFEPDSKGYVSLLDYARRYADAIIYANDLFEYTLELAQNEISLYRRFLPLHFQGMQEAKPLPKELLAEDFATLEDRIYKVSPFVYRLITRQRDSYPEEREIALTAARESQEHIFKYVSNPISFGNIMGDLRAVDWDEMRDFARSVASLSRGKTQLAGNIRPYDKKIEQINPEHPRYKEFCDLGMKAMRHLVRITLAAGRGFFPSSPSTGMDEIPELDDMSFFEIQAADIKRAQKKYGCTIPWVIMIPYGQSGEEVKTFFKQHNRFRLNVHLIQQNRMSHILDASGKLIVDEDSRLLTSTLGHGTLPKTIVESAKMRERIKAFRYAFVSGIKNLGASISDEIFLATLGRHISEGENHLITAEMVYRAVYPEVKIFPIYVEEKPRLLPDYVLPGETTNAAVKRGAPFHNLNMVLSLKAVEEMAKMDIPAFLKMNREWQRFMLMDHLEAFVGLMPTLFVEVPADRHILSTGISDIDAVREYKEKWSAIEKRDKDAH